MAVTFNYVEDTRPVNFATVSNPQGYWDLYLNKSKNGKAIRISNRVGTDAVNIAVEKLDDLISALQAIKARGAAVGTSVLPYNHV